MTDNQSKKMELPPRILIVSGLPMDAEGNVITDDNGKPLSSGVYHHKGLDVYAKTFKFRPLKYMLSYIQYNDPEANDFSIKGYSIYRDVKQGYYTPGMIDTLGTERCGRPTSKEVQAMPPEKQKDVRVRTPVFINLFGVAYFENQEPVLSELRVSGRKIVQLSDVIDKAIATNATVNRDNAQEVVPKELLKHELEFSLEKAIDSSGNERKTPQGNFIWEVSAKSVGYNKKLKDVKDEMEQINNFINNHNSYVQTMYTQATSEKSAVADILDDEDPF